MVIGTMVDRSMRAASRLMVALHVVLSQYCLHVVSELVFIVWAFSWPSVRVVSQLVFTLMPVCGLGVALHSDASVWSPMCVVSQLVFSVWSHGWSSVCGLTVGLQWVWSDSWSSQ